MLLIKSCVWLCVGGKNRKKELEAEIQRESVPCNQLAMKSLSCQETGVEEEMRPLVIAHFPLDSFLSHPITVIY